MAPQAMVTNSIGQSGWRAPPAIVGAKPLNASTLNAATLAFVNGARTAPTALTRMTIAVIQNPM